MTDETVAVEQCDRNRAAAIASAMGFSTILHEDIRSGAKDYTPIVQEVARHRIAVLAHPRPALDREAVKDIAGSGVVSKWLTREGRGFQVIWRGKEQREFFSDEDDAYERLAELRAAAILALATPPARLPGESTTP